MTGRPVCGRTWVPPQSRGDPGHYRTDYGTSYAARYRGEKTVVREDGEEVSRTEGSGALAESICPDAGSRLPDAVGAAAVIRRLGRGAGLAMSLLDTILRPLSAHYEDPATVELRMTGPGAVILDRREQGKFRVEDARLTLPAVESACRSLANLNGLCFDPDEAPKLSCVLPGGHRFECLAGASVQSGLSLAIRCKHPFTPGWDQLGAAGAPESWLKAALARAANMVISGAANTGKTTLLNMLLAGLPDDRRVVALKDTPELHLARFWDGVGLVAAREAAASAGRASWRELYDHVMRATPDHIVFGEISTQNAYAALAALNSGTADFLCTIHADSPEQAIARKFDQNIAWSGEAMPRVPEFLRGLVDAVVQLKRAPDGYRRISDIYQPRLDSYLMCDGQALDARAVATNPARDRPGARAGRDP